MTRTKTRKTPTVSPTMRCAIYTRKSTEDGLEQEFNSLDAQRLAGENYIRSQVDEGWEIIPDEYDDGGFTGGNMDRPALLFTTTFGTFPREYSPLTLRVGINRIETSEMPTGIAG